jgi:hypothetical protein
MLARDHRGAYTPFPNAGSLPARLRYGRRSVSFIPAAGRRHAAPLLPSTLRPAIDDRQHRLGPFPAGMSTSPRVEPDHGTHEAGCSDDPTEPSHPVLHALCQPVYRDDRFAPSGAVVGQASWYKSMKCFNVIWLGPGHYRLCLHAPSVRANRSRAMRAPSHASNKRRRATDFRYRLRFSQGVTVIGSRRSRVRRTKQVAGPIEHIHRFKAA